MSEMGLIVVIVSLFLLFGFSVMLYVILRPIWDRVNKRKDIDG